MADSDAKSSDDAVATEYDGRSRPPLSGDLLGEGVPLPPPRWGTTYEVVHDADWPAEAWRRTLLEGMTAAAHQRFEAYVEELKVEMPERIKWRWRELQVLEHELNDLRATFNGNDVLEPAPAA